jgi:hypothetical protein
LTTVLRLCIAEVMRRRTVFIRFFQALPLVANVACSSSSPKIVANNNTNWPAGAALKQPPSDIPEPVRSQILSLAQDFATALCDHAATCCVSLNMPLNKNCVTYSSVVWSNADIARDASAPDSILEYAFDESRATACRDRLAQLESGCGFELLRASSTDMIAMDVLQTFCSAALSVTVSGQPWQCWSDAGCLAYGDGLACVNAKCVDKANVGDTCQGTDVDAGTGTGTCVTELTLNDACSTTNGPNCAAGLVCIASVCVPKAADGEACMLTTDCADNLHCVPSSQSDPTGAGICQGLGPRGQVPCTESWQCDHECVSGYCDPRQNGFCESPY